LTAYPLTTIGEACDAFLAHCRLAKNLAGNTLRAYAVDLAEFRAFAGADTALAQCDRTLLRAFLKHLFEARGLKETSVKRRMACLKVMFRWLETEEVLEISPFHRLNVRIRLPKRLPRALSSGEVQALLAEAAARAGLRPGGRYDASGVASAGGPAGIADLTLLVAIELMVTTGVRVGELTAIGERDVDVADRTVRITGKGNRERKVFLVDDGIAALVAGYLAARARLPVWTDRLLVTAGGGPADAQSLRKALRTLAEAAGLNRPVTPHMLRHTAATLLLEAGVDIRFVQRLLGHQSISTTEIYTAVSDVQLKNAVVGARGRRK
jgi:integrase/recombinase XerD